MRHWPILLLLLAIPGVALAQHGHEGADHDATMRHGFEDVERWVQRFEDPERASWQRPQLVLRLLGLEPGDQVADLGTGTGYFLPWLSSMVTRAGRVYAVDIESAMLEYIRQRKDLPNDNVITVLAEPDDPKLPAGQLDCVMIVDTWHHIDDRLNYLKHLEKALRPGGRVVVIDYHEGELPVGPPAGHKLSRDAVVAEFEKGGWTLGGESVALPYQYYLAFKPPRP